MKTMQPGYEILVPNELTAEKRQAIYRNIENAARTCYKSEKELTEESGDRMIRNLIKKGHTAMLEHASITVKFTVDRGITHEIVRHRHFSFAQESTRYCDYSNGRHGGQVMFIDPRNAIENIDPVTSTLEEDMIELIYDEWLEACIDAEEHYMKMISFGAPAQIARSVLNNSDKSEIVVTGNMREWRHFLKLRAAGVTGAPHPQMQEVAIPLLVELKEFLPALFMDIWEECENRRNNK